MTNITYLKKGGEQGYRIVLTAIDAYLKSGSLERGCSGTGAMIAAQSANFSVITWEVDSCAEALTSVVLWTAVTTTPRAPYQVRIEAFDDQGVRLPTHPGSTNPLEVQGATGSSMGHHGSATVMVL